MKLVPTAVAGALTIALAQFAVAQTATDTRQYPTTQSPSVNAERNQSYSQRGNTSYPGQENQRQNPQYGQSNRSDQDGASGGQTRDRDDERHDNGKHKGEYKRDNDGQTRGDDDRDRRGGNEDHGRD